MANKQAAFSDFLTRSQLTGSLFIALIFASLTFVLATTDPSNGTVLPTESATPLDAVCSTTAGECGTAPNCSQRCANVNNYIRAACIIVEGLNTCFCYFSCALAGSP
ncbi:hypothetical protein SO802_002927 [Lithocarpus litseifolius]|uniref:Uncharacterized protein n=1 Tax=Lithocarpus litseifolius TaxID=425828 RepID=A0AAW2DYW8_9ROSI